MIFNGSFVDWRMFFFGFWRAGRDRALIMMFWSRKGLLQMHDIGQMILHICTLPELNHPHMATVRKPTSLVNIPKITNNRHGLYSNVHKYLVSIGMDRRMHTLCRYMCANIHTYLLMDVWWWVYTHVSIAAISCYMYTCVYMCNILYISANLRDADHDDFNSQRFAVKATWPRIKATINLELNLKHH